SGGNTASRQTSCPRARWAPTVICLPHRCPWPYPRSAQCRAGRRLFFGIVVILGLPGRRARACDPHVRRVKARTPLAGGVAALVASAVVLAACSSPGTGHGATPGDSPLPVEVPLDATFAIGSAVEAVVPMGRLNDRLETFWQLFFRSTATSPWELSTPPGVPANGG